MGRMTQSNINAPNQATRHSPFRAMDEVTLARRWFVQVAKHPSSSSPSNDTISDSDNDNDNDTSALLSQQVTNNHHGGIRRTRSSRIRALFHDLDSP